MFMEGTNEGKEGRASLFRVLAVYAMYNPQVSYCQGILPFLEYVTVITCLCDRPAALMLSQDNLSMI